MQNEEWEMPSAGRTFFLLHSAFFLLPFCMMFADLHLHTTFSDGTYSPAALVAAGQRFGFAALALTDHDTVDGCDRMHAACRAADIEFVPASELTAEARGHELHLLGYYLDTGNLKLLGELAKFQAVRQNR